MHDIKHVAVLSLLASDSPGLEQEVQSISAVQNPVFASWVSNSQGFIFEQYFNRARAFGEVVVQPFELKFIDIEFGGNSQAAANGLMLLG